MKTWMKLAIGLSIGAAAGFAYYFFIGCKTGTCPITSSPVISTLYGAVMGLLMAWPGKRLQVEAGSTPENH